MVQMEMLALSSIYLRLIELIRHPLACIEYLSLEHLTQAYTQDQLRGLITENQVSLTTFSDFLAFTNENLTMCQEWQLNRRFEASDANDEDEWPEIFQGWNADGQRVKTAIEARRGVQPRETRECYRTYQATGRFEGLSYYRFDNLVGRTVACLLRDIENYLVL